MYHARHSHNYCRRFSKPDPFVESPFGQVFLGSIFTFGLALLAGCIFFSK